jgi:hypothetical protein
LFVGIQKVPTRGSLLILLSHLDAVDIRTNGDLVTIVGDSLPSREAVDLSSNNAPLQLSDVQLICHDLTGSSIFQDAEGVK